MAESASIVFQYYQQWDLKNSFLRARNVPKKVRFRGLMIQNLSMLKGMKKKISINNKSPSQNSEKVYRRNNSTLEMQPYGSITKPICEGY